MPFVGAISVRYNAETKSGAIGSLSASSRVGGLHCGVQDGSDSTQDSDMPGDRRQDTDEILHAARAGDVEALGQLLERAHNYLGLLARLQIGRRLQGKVDPEDLIQDVFLTAHDCFDQFRGVTGAEWLGWLRQILASRVADLMRRHFGARARDVRLERELSAELEMSSQALDGGLIDRGPSPSKQASRAEQAMLLADALERLPEDYREVIILHHLEDLPFPEVARRMKRSLDSVKNLWLRALARLRRTLRSGS